MSLIIHPGAVFVAVAVRAATGVHVAVAVDGGGGVVALLLLRLRRLCDALAQRVVVRRARSEEEAKVAKSEHLKFRFEWRCLCDYDFIQFQSKEQV